jgi:hypothetical protein
MSDMKRSVIVISSEGTLVPDPAGEMVFETPELVFKPEDAAPLGALVCWVEVPAGPAGAGTAGDCEVEPVGAGVKPTLEDIWW